MDQIHMRPIFEKLGRAFPLERRREVVKTRGTIIVARDGEGRLAGYLEYGPGRDDPTEIYFSSIQIAAEHRSGRALRLLLRHALVSGDLVAGRRITTQVQITNEPAVDLLRRIGFQVDEASAKNGTIAASMIVPADRARARWWRS